MKTAFKDLGQSRHCNSFQMGKDGCSVRDFGLDIQALIVGRTSSGFGSQVKAGAGYPSSVGRRIIPAAGYPGGDWVRTIES